MCTTLPPGQASPIQPIPPPNGATQLTDTLGQLIFSEPSQVSYVGCIGVVVGLPGSHCYFSARFERLFFRAPAKSDSSKFWDIFPLFSRM